MSSTTDRLSKLPDQLLHRILADPIFSLTHAITCSLFSSRWRMLWASMPDLVFDDSVTINGPQQPEFFPAFVDSALLLRNKDADVTSFRLRWNCEPEPYAQHHLYTWCQYATNHKVAVVDLHIYLDTNKLDLPSCLFLSETLRELKLSFSQGISLNPRLVQLGQLKKIHFTRLVIDEIPMKRLVSGCPVLEELILVESWLTSPAICSDSLRSLIIGKCAILGKEMKVSCPNLLTFRFIQNYVGRVKISLENLSSLVDASVFTNDYHGYTYDGDLVCFITGLSNAKSLEFISAKMKSISEEELSETLVFHNLKRLTLGGWHMNEKFVAISYFFDHSPNLEMITLRREQRVFHREDKAAQGLLEAGSSMHIESEAAMEPGEPASSNRIEREEAHERTEPESSVYVEREKQTGIEEAQETREPICTRLVKIVEFQAKWCANTGHELRYLLKNGNTISEKVIIIPHVLQRGSMTWFDKEKLTAIKKEIDELQKKCMAIDQQKQDIMRRTKDQSGSGPSRDVVNSGAGTST